MVIAKCCLSWLCVFRCLSFVVCLLLFVVGCWLRVASCSLCVVGCLWFGVVARWLLFRVCCCGGLVVVCCNVFDV